MEEGADAIGRRGDFFNDLLQLLDGLARLAHGLLLAGDQGADIEKFFAHGIAGREGGDGAVEGLEGCQALVALRKVVADHPRQL